MAGFFGLHDWQFWLSAGYFWLLVIVTLWLPGWLLLTHFTHLSRLTRLLAAPALGIVILTLVAFFGGSIGVYWLVWVYFAIIAFAILLEWRYFGSLFNSSNARRLTQGLTKNKTLILLVLLALAIQLPAIFGSGLRTSDGIRFFFTNNQDGLMHLGFIESLSHTFPPLRPEINQPLTDYHYFTDLLLAQFVRAGLPAINLFCQFWPVLISIITTGVLYQSLREITSSQKAATFTTLTWILASEGAFWLTFFFPAHQGWDMATLDNGADVFLNMPYATARLLFLVAWLLLAHFWQKRRRSTLPLIALLVIPLTLFKVYWMILFLSGWVSVSFVKIVISCIESFHVRESLFMKSKFLPAKFISQLRAHLAEYLTLSLTIIASFLLLHTVTTTQASQFAWVPNLWPQLLATHQHLGWTNWELRQQIYAADPSLPRQVLDFVLILFVAILYIFGGRLAAFFPSRASLKLLNWHHYVFFLLPALICTIIGLNTLQGIGGYNSFNFLVIAAVAMIIPLGCHLAIWWDKNIWGQILCVLILISFLPRTLRNAWYYTTQTLTNQGKLYDTADLDLLEHLRALTAIDDAILVSVENPFFMESSVIPALAGRRTFLSDEALLDTHNINYQDRDKRVRDILTDIHLDGTFAMLRDEGIAAVVLGREDLAIRPYAIATASAAYSGDAGKIILTPRLEIAP